MDFISGQVPCSYHPDVMTGLRCNHCGKPICPLDSVRTPVGLRCPDCAGVRMVGTVRTPVDALLKASLAGLCVAVGVAVLWRFFPNWEFYLALLLGFGVVETVAWATNNKRGLDLQILSMVLVTIGLVLSRVLLADRYGITMDHLRLARDFSLQLLQLQIVPSLIFVAVCYLICWVRFR